MQKEHNNIDELFRSELSDIETAAPLFVKKQLDKKLFKKKKFILFLIPSLLCIGLISIILYNTTNTTKKLSQTSTQNSLKTQTIDKSNTPTTLDKELYTKANSNINTIDNSPVIQNSTKSKQSNTRTTTYSTAVVKNNSKRVQNKNSVSVPTNTPTIQADNNDLNSVKPKNKQKPTITPFTNKVNNVVDISKSNLSKSQNISKVNAASIQNDISINTLLTSKPLQPKNTNLDSVETNNNKVTFIDSLSNDQQTKIAETPIPTSKDEIKKAETNSDSIVRDISTGLEIHHNLSNTSKSIGYLFSWTTGLNLSKSTYSSVNNLDANYYQANNTDELNFEHTINADVVVKNNFLIGSGISISRQSYAYSYDEISTSFFATIDSSLIFSNYVYGTDDTLQILQPIDSIYQMTIDTTTSSSTSKVSYNGVSQAQYIHIPFQIGYLYNINRFMLGIQANIRYNLLYNASGKFYENNKVNEFDKTNSIFKNSYFDVSIKASIYYNFYNNLSLHGSVKYTPQLNNTFQNSIIERKLNNYQFGLGLSYKF